MNALRVLDGLYFIERGYLNANHFVACGTGTVDLVDTGYLGSLDETIDSLAELGVTPNGIDRIVSTHCHCDHIGANLHIQQRSRCQVLMHPAGK